MKIFVASTNKHKLKGVQVAALDTFNTTDANIDIEGFKALSGVNEQPVGQSETLKGALQRLEHLKQSIDEHTHYDYLVSVENGIMHMTINNEPAWLGMGWVVIENAAGHRVTTGHSTGLIYDTNMVEEAQALGFDTTTVGAMLAKHNGGDPHDPHSMTSGQAYSRSDLLAIILKSSFAQHQCKFGSP